MNLKNKKGQSIVEFALVLPVLLLLLLGIIEFGLAFNSHVTLVHAAREGARYGAVHYNAGTEEAITAVENTVKAAAVGLNPAELVLNPAPNWVDGELTVNVEYTFHLIDPVISAIVGEDLVLRASAIMAIE